MSDPQTKLILGIDTSGTEGSLALVRVSADGAEFLIALKALTGRHYSAELIPTLREMLSDAGVTPKDLNAIVVISGPGSFTGLRIGISATKALAEAAELPVIAVSRLAVLSSLAGKVTVAVLDAGRSEYYLRAASAEDAPAESLESLTTLIEKVTHTKVCICEPKLTEQLSTLDLLLLPPPTAADAIHFAWPRVLAGSFDDVASLDANYVRRPYADQPGAARTTGITLS